MVVALVFLELEGFDDESEVVVYLLELLPVKLLWFDQLLVDCRFAWLNSAAEIFQLRQKGLHFTLAPTPRPSSHSWSWGRAKVGGGVGPPEVIMDPGDCVTLRGESNGALLAEVQLLIICDSEKDSLLTSMILAVGMQLWSWRRSTHSDTIDWRFDRGFAEKGSRSAYFNVRYLLFVVRLVDVLHLLANGYIINDLIDQKLR